MKKTKIQQYTHFPLSELRVREIIKEELGAFEIRLEKKVDIKIDIFRKEVRYEFELMKNEMKRMFDEQKDFISNMMSSFLETVERNRMLGEATERRLSIVEKKSEAYEKRFLKIEKKVFV